MNDQKCAAEILPIKDMQTRFIHTFSFDPERFRAAVNHMLGDRLVRRESDGPALWRVPLKPHHFYQDELLDHVGRHLFTPETGPCAYLQITDVAQAWFRDTNIDLPRKRKVLVRIGEGAGIELFLSSFGVGVLSIRLAAGSADPTIGLDYSQALDFNYRLAQHRRSDVTKIHKRHAKDNVETYKKMSPDQQRGIPDPPSEDALLEQRLGAPGGQFDLNELATRLLKPLQEFGLSPVGLFEFLAYTVVRFGSESDFDSLAAQKPLAALLSGLAQVEESDHAGAPAGRITVPSALLNRHHWAAIGLLGAAHLVADQTDKDGGFNELRPRIVSDKYFIPYLVALQQRVVLNRASDDAARIVALKRGERGRRLTRLRDDLLVFGVGGQFMQVSSRHALHRYYRLTRRGLGVLEAWQDVRQAVTDLADQEATRRQRRLARGFAKNLTTITNVQKVVHTIEYLLASVYLAHLWHMATNENHWMEEYFGPGLWHWFVSGGVVVAAGIGFLTVFIVNRFIERRSHSESTARSLEHSRKPT
jgi:hypothetical protein